MAISGENKQAGEIFAKKANTDWIPHWEDIVKREDIDAICIASENQDHYRQIIDSLSASKHVLCENPLTLDIKKFENITKTRMDTNTKILVPFKPRFNSSLIQIKKLVKQGDIGEIGGIYFSIFVPQQNKREESCFTSKEKVGDGCIIDIGSQAFDYILWIVEAKPERLYTISKNITNGGPEIAAVTTIRFSNGTIVTINVSCLQGKYETKTSIQKTEEMNIELSGYNRTIIIDAYHQRLRMYRLNQNSIEQVYWGSLESTNIIEYFIDSIKNNNEMVPDEKDAEKALKLVLASYESVKNRDWVKL